MGKFTVYKKTDASEDYQDRFNNPKGWPDTADARGRRQQGMRALGEKLQENIINEANFRKAVLETFKYFLDPNNPYELRYEAIGQHGEFSFRLGGFVTDPDDPGKKAFKVVDFACPPVGQGHVRPEIERDESKGNHHIMRITIPRGKADAFNYVDEVVDDIHALGSDEDSENYLKGALTFQRCL